MQDLDQTIFQTSLAHKDELWGHDYKYFGEYQVSYDDIHLLCTWCQLRVGIIMGRL